MPYIDHITFNNTRYELQGHPYAYLLDGTNLSTAFSDAAAFRAAVAAGDFSRIHIGDYWPMTLNGTFYDYGAYTVQAGTVYYTDAALTDVVAATTATLEGQYESATAVKCTVSGASVYCAIGDCLPYFERTLTNAVVNLEVAGINNYWRYGDSGTLGNNTPHVTFISRDCLPIRLRMRKANAVWENATATNPWVGSALFKTLNDPDHGIVTLLAATDIGAYVYGGPNGAGMRAMMERKAAGAPNATGSGWEDRGQLFLPFESEIWGNPIWSGSGFSMGCGLQIPIFDGSRRHISKGIGNNASRAYWWTASSYAGSPTLLCAFDGYGVPSYNNGSVAYGVPVCFVVA